MKRIMFVALLSACTPNTTAPVKTETPPSYFTVTLPEGEGGTFEVSRGGQDGYEKEPTNVIIGDQSTVVGLGERKTFSFGLNPNGLTRIWIGNIALLIHAQPTQTVSLGDDPCNGWSLYDDVYDHTFAKPPLAACAEEGDDCPTGMLEAGFPALAADPLCKDPEAQTGRRCLIPSVFEWTGTTPLRWAQDDQPIDGPTSLMPRFRCFDGVKTGTDEVQLVIGMGERWTLKEEGGKITGTSTPLELK